MSHAADADVIGLCEQFVAGHAEASRLGDSDASDSLVSAGRCAIRLAAAMPAATLAGWQAKARALQCLNGDCPELAASLAADVLCGL